MFFELCQAFYYRNIKEIITQKPKNNIKKGLKAIDFLKLMCYNIDSKA
jgi:hypothetical protein